ncbi:MAG: YjdF family protein [Hespellia sp.]|nr:YjdF family protein [Hespellia sp.]
MNKVTSSLIVLFEEPFWIGVFEKVEDGRLSVAKVTFGAEPKDYEILAFVLQHDYDLCYSPAVATAVNERKKNPKRIQRDVKKQLQVTGIGTKSQQALKLQQEEFKSNRKLRSREQKEAEAERRFELKQQKKKEKHRGH